MLFFVHRKKWCIPAAGILITVSIFFSVPVFAQDERLPDSVVVNDTASENHPGAATTPEEDSVILRTVPDSVASAYRNSHDFEYANDPAYWVKEPVDNRENFLEHIIEWVQRQQWFRYLILGLLASVLLYALYRIVISNGLFMFYASPKTEDIKTVTPENDSFDHLDEKIQASMHANDLRLAFRYKYLKALKIAGDRGLIQLNARDTSRQYLGQMRHHPQENNFRILTHAYEWVWYGNFSLDREQFDAFQPRFEEFYKAAGN